MHGTGFPILFPSQPTRERASSSALIGLGAVKSALEESSRLSTGGPGNRRTPDLLHAMHASFIRGGLAGSALCRSEGYDSPRSSRWVWRKLMP